MSFTLVRNNKDKRVLIRTDRIEGIIEDATEDNCHLLTVLGHPNTYKIVGDFDEFIKTFLGEAALDF